MGNYFNPPKDVESKGRKLSAYPLTWDALNKTLAPDEVVIGLFDRGLFFCAPLLDSKEEYEEFDAAYGRGAFLSADYYAVRRAVASQHMDYPLT